MKPFFSSFSNKLPKPWTVSSLLFFSLFGIPTLLLIISIITYFYIMDPRALFVLFQLLLLLWSITLLFYFFLCLLIALYYFMWNKYREYFASQLIEASSKEDGALSKQYFYLDPTSKVKFVWHPDGY